MPFARPTTTATPDEIFEEWVHVLRHAELLALLYVVRRTLGFKKATDSISYTQLLDGITTREGKVLDRGCGVKNRTTLAAALRRLEDLRLIRSYKAQDARGDRATTRYGLWFAGDAVGDDDHTTGRADDHPADRPTHKAEEGGTQIVPPQYAHCTTGSTPAVPPVVRPTYLQQTIETTNTTQQTDLSKRAPQTLPSHPSLDSTDSMVVTGDAVSTEQPADPDASPLSAVVARLSAEFGDDAPQASRTRVLNMQRAAVLSDEALLALLDEAAAIARVQAPMITKRGRGGAVIRMPYLLATVRGLIEATDETIGSPETGAIVTLVMGDPHAPDADAPPATTMAEALWRAVVGEVRQDVTAENYNTWFAPTRALALDGDVLRVGVPTPFHRQWLEHKLHGCVDRALGHTGHAGVRIAYDVVTLAERTTLAERASIGDRAADQMTALDPSIVPRPPASSRETPAVAPTRRPPVASIVVPPLVVACPSCRVAPCRCRLTEQLRRVVAARSPDPGESPVMGRAGHASHRRLTSKPHRVGYEGDAHGTHRVRLPREKAIVAVVASAARSGRDDRRAVAAGSLGRRPGADEVT